MNNLPLQPLVWTTESDIPSAKSPLYYYDIIREYSCGESCFVRYQKVEAGCNIKQATGFSSFDEAKAWAWNHYNEKMQPYVKPMPTWIDASKQLPNVDRDTQFICAYDSAIDTFSKVAWFNADIGKFDYQHDDVLAWMPIPEFSTMQNLHKGE